MSFACFLTKGSQSTVPIKNRNIPESYQRNFGNFNQSNKLGDRKQIQFVYVW